MLLTPLGCPQVTCPLWALSKQHKICSVVAAEGKDSALRLCWDVPHDPGFPSSSDESQQQMGWLWPGGWGAAVSSGPGGGEESPEPLALNLGS